MLCRCECPRCCQRGPACLASFAHHLPRAPSYPPPPPLCASTALVQAPLPGETVIFCTVTFTVQNGFLVCFVQRCASLSATLCTFLLRKYSHSLSCSPACLFFHLRSPLKYRRSTVDMADGVVVGPSPLGDRFISIKYECGGSLSLNQPVT